jgi:hypothetical protein
MRTQQNILQPPAVVADSQQRIPASMPAVDVSAPDVSAEKSGAETSSAPSIVQQHPKKSLTAAALVGLALGGGGGYLATPTAPQEPAAKSAAPANPSTAAVAAKRSRLFVTIVGRKVGEAPWVAGVATSREIAAYCSSRGHVLLECADDDPRLASSNLAKHLWDAGGAPALICQVADQGNDWGRVRRKGPLENSVAANLKAIQDAETTP